MTSFPPSHRRPRLPHLPHLPHTSPLAAGRPAPPVTACSLEHRITNAVLLVGSFVSAFATVLNPWLGLPHETTVLTAVGAVGYAALYVWSERRERFTAPAVIALSLLALVYYPVLWLTNAGLDGGIHFIGLIGLIATTCTLSGWRRHALWALFAAVTVALFAGEYLGWIAVEPYDTRLARFADVFVSFVIAAIALVAFVAIQRQHYHQERERGLAYSQALAESHEELERALREIDQLSRTDPLTQLPNRRHFNERLASRLTEAERYQRPLSVALFDIDHFKAINDRHGHAGGDTVLVELARRIQADVRSTDLVARWGGEEFVMLLPETDAEGARIAGERIRAAVAGHPFGCGIDVTISMGLATHRPGDTLESLIGRADAATYRAKQGGRNQVMAA